MAYLEIHTVDVGQGDCQFIAVKNEVTNSIQSLIMIDSGKDSAAKNVHNYWYTNFGSPTMGSKKVDTLIISHWDEDHYGGMDAIICETKKINTAVQNMFEVHEENILYNGNNECFTCLNVFAPTTECLWFNGTYVFYPGDQSTTNFAYKRQQYNKPTIIENIKISFLCEDNKIFNAERGDDSSIKNKSSIAILVELLDTSKEAIFRYYTGGDLSGRQEDELVKKDKFKTPKGSNKLHSIKLSHHGSNTATTGYFLDSTSPGLAICSHGNRHGHPTSDTLELLRKQKVTTLLTNPTENIGCKVQGVAYAGNPLSNVAGNIVQTFSPQQESHRVEAIFTLEQYTNITKHPFRNGAPCINGIITIAPTNILQIQSKLFSNSNNSNPKQAYKILKLINNYIGDDFDNYFPYFVQEIFGEIDNKNINKKSDTDQLKELEITLSNHITISSQIAFQNSKIDLISTKSTIGENTITFFHARLSSMLKIKENNFDIHIDFSSNNIWDLEIDPKNLSLLDIPEIIPDFNSSVIDDWAKAMHLQNILIERAAIGVNFSSKTDKVQHVNLGLAYTIFGSHKLQLTTMYRLSEGVSVYGGLSESITVHELLKASGVSAKHVKIFPNIEIDDFGFSAIPKEKNYRIQARISNISETFSIGEIGIMISSLSFEINKQETNTCISVEIEGIFNDKGITIKSDYDSTNGFVFTGTIEEIDTNSLLSEVHVKLPEEIKLPKFEDITIVSSPFSINAKTNADFKNVIEGVTFEFKINEFSYTKADNYKITGGINLFNIDTIFSIQKDEINIHISEIDFSNILHDVGVNKSIANIFSIKVNDVDLSIQKDKFSFNSEFKELLITKGFLLHDNTIEFAITKGTGLNLKILTHLDIDFDENNKIKCTGGLSIFPESLSFFAKSEGSIKNVFGINEFNFGELFVSLNKSKTGLGVGFMGNLEFKKLSGQIALYFSTTNPTDKLLAVNLDSLTLLDIVGSIVECKNTGIDDILDSIGIKPIELDKNIAKPELNENIKTIIKNTDKDASGNYTLKSESDDGYNWLPEKSYLVEDKSKFRSYVLRHKSDNNYTFEKWISLYGCTSAINIELNGCNFEPGFAFSGELNFLGIKQIVDFKATPSQGILLYLEMEESIKLGADILTLCRVEDKSKGPILSLSTYPNDRHFYLSAKLKILSIIDFETRILFADNKFAFMLNQNILGFRSSIKAAGSFDSFNKTNFGIDFIFETNGFTEITQEISKILHEAADEVQKKAHNVSSKLAGARRTVKEFQRHITNSQSNIDRKNSELSKLTHTHYPWYKSYKYVALGVRIASVSVQIAGLYTYKGAQIALLEAANGVLYLAQKAVEATGDLAAGVIEGLADVVAVIGKSIDWLIKINKVNAAFALDQNHQEYVFALDFDLCGKNHTPSFQLSIDGSLKDVLLSKIRSLIHTTKQLQMSNINNEEQIIHELDQIYGVISPKEVKSVEVLKAEHAQLLNKNTNIKSDRNINYTQILNNTRNDIKIIQETLGINTKNCNYTCSIDQETILTLKDEISSYATEQKKQQEFLDKHKESSEQIIESLNEKLMIFSDNHLKEYNSSLYKEFLSKTETISVQLDSQKKEWDKFKTSTDLDRNIENLFDSVDKLGNSSIIDENIGENTLFSSESETIPQESKLEIIKNYEDLTNDDSSLSPYMKAMFYKNLGIAYAETGDKNKSKKNFSNALNLYEDLFGQNSEEVKITKAVMQDYI